MDQPHLSAVLTDIGVKICRNAEVSFILPFLKKTMFRNWSDQMSSTTGISSTNILVGSYTTSFTNYDGKKSHRNGVPSRAFVATRLSTFELHADRSFWWFTATHESRLIKFFRFGLFVMPIEWAMEFAVDPLWTGLSFSRSDCTRPNYTNATRVLFGTSKNCIFFFVVQLWIKFVFVSSQVGERLVYYCDQAGYKLGADNVLECQEAGQWSRPVPFCVNVAGVKSSPMPQLL